MPKKRSSSNKRMMIIGFLFIALAAISGILAWHKTQYGVLGAVAEVKSLLQKAGSKGEQIIRPTSSSQKEVRYKFAILSDTHEDVSIYPQLVANISARKDLSFVVHLGDQSNAGELSKLQESKAILDRIAVPVYVLPGDHDLNWMPRHDLTNFKSTFGLQQTSYHIKVKNDHYLFIDNSDSQNGLSATTMSWIESELGKSTSGSIYVFMSTPLSNPYLSFKTMGAQSEMVKGQAKELGQLLKRYGVRVIFAGDTHTFSQYKDQDSNLPIVTVGAAGTNKNPLPMYVLVEILSDGSYNVTSMPLQQN